jgi:hypothetical protein
MAFRQRVPTQSQHAGDWHVDSLATAAGQKQAREQERGVQVTLRMSEGVASFTLNVSTPKAAVRAFRVASLRSVEGHARQHLHLRQSAAPLQVSGGMPMLEQGAPLRFASGTFFGRCARSRLGWVFGIRSWSPGPSA